MHFQSGVNGWTTILPLLPDGAIIKAFDGGLLEEAKQKWTALGRDPRKLTTCLRHYDVDYFFSTDLAACRTAWRNNFARFIDGTYLSRYAPHIDLVETLNEHTDTRMVTDRELLAPHLVTEQAAVDVWEADYRGRLLPAHVRLVLCNSPVGNDIPREFYKLAVDSDNVLGIHPYMHIVNSIRDPGCWRYHSGRPFFNEQEYGLHPLYAMTECGPYASAAEGWRAPLVLGGDVGKMVAYYRQWWAQLAGTPAYQQGRILGPGCYFTSGGFGWEWYRYETPELILLADAARADWKQEPFDMDAVLKAKIKEHAEAIIALVSAHVWIVGDVALANTNPLITYTAPNGPVKDRRPATPPGGPMVTYDLNVLEVTADQLWLRVAVGMWVKTADVKLKGS